MARFIEVRNLEGYKILINVDNIQSIRQVDGLGKTCILLKAVTSNEPKVIATSRYSINETCELLGITRKTLQKYTMFGLIKCGLRKATMKKFYTGLEIMKFWRTAV